MSDEDPKHEAGTDPLETVFRSSKYLQNEEIARILGFRKESIRGFGVCWRYPSDWSQATEPERSIPNFLEILERAIAMIGSGGPRQWL